VPIELGYDNYFTNEDAGLGSQFMWRTRHTICHVKKTSAHCQQIIFLTHEWWEPFISLFGVQVDGNDKPIKTQHFSKNEDQNHSYKETWLLSCPTDTSITNNTYGKPSGQSAESYSQPCTQVNKSPENKNQWYVAALHIVHLHFGNKQKLEEFVDYSKTLNHLLYQGSKASTPLQKASL